MPGPERADLLRCQGVCGLRCLCEHLEIPVHRWHGDVPGSKKAFLANTDSTAVPVSAEEEVRSRCRARRSHTEAVVGGLRITGRDQACHQRPWRWSSSWR